MHISFISRFGPLIVSWCMRMEAKNSYFKKVARISNFKNVPYSVAKRHQRLLCAHLQGQFFLTMNCSVDHVSVLWFCIHCMQELEYIKKIHDMLYSIYR